MDDRLSSSFSPFERDSEPHQPEGALPKDASLTKHQRRLQGRNARFPAKRLSLSGLSNKLTDLGEAGERTERILVDFNKENRSPNDKKTGTLVLKEAARSFGILEELSNSATTKNLLLLGENSTHQDNSTCSPPKAVQPGFSFDDFSIHCDDVASPSFNDLEDTLTQARMRDRDETGPGWDKLSHATANFRGLQRAHSAGRFDADQYIDHIERELQYAKDEAYSPLTRRPLKEKLRIANKEIERLQHELTLLRETFETEVKKTVEHKTAVEVELRRKVRDLEEALEDKVLLIQHLQDEHEERRLDSNTVDVLRSAIDRLELDKQNLEHVNLSMSKRNEVLTELLAMSPPKASQPADLRSPVRERRNTRPMSLVLPRLLSSPKHISPVTTISQATSPRALKDGEISPLKLSPRAASVTEAKFCSDGPIDSSSRDCSAPSSPANESYFRQAHLGSSTSTTVPVTGADDARPLTRRKPRRFVAGSTQLKPLLLPALTGESGQMVLDSAPSSSCFSSPRSLSDTAFTPLLEKSMAPATSNDMDDADMQEEPKMQSMFEPGPAITEDRSDCVQLELSGCGDAWLSIGAVLQRSPHQRPRTAYSRISSLHEQLDHHAAEVSALFQTQAEQDSSPYNETLAKDTQFNVPMPLFSPGAPNVVPAYVWQSLDNSPITSPLASLASKKRRRISRAPEQPMLPSPLQVRNAPVRIKTPIPRSDCNVPSIRRTNNFVGLMSPDRRDVRTLTAVSIGTVYSIITHCVKGYRNFRRDPYALARRIIANAWHCNWKLLGKLSWWVLGLFISPRTPHKARAAIDWDQYDGESIADRYCKRLDEGDNGETRQCLPQRAENIETETTTPSKPACWTKSISLWGKFSFAMLLAVGGAVVKGPGEMLKDIEPVEAPRGRRPRHVSLRSHASCIAQSLHSNKSQASVDTGEDSLPLQVYFPLPSSRSTSAASFDFRSSLQIDALEKPDPGPSPDGDITLRPVKRPRARVEDIFQVTSGEKPSDQDQSLSLSHGLHADLAADDEPPDRPSTDLATDLEPSHVHSSLDPNFHSNPSVDNTAALTPPYNFA